jgi:hypothetical protein
MVGPPSPEFAIAGAGNRRDRLREGGADEHDRQNNTRKSRRHMFFSQASWMATFFVNPTSITKAPKSICPPDTSRALNALPATCASSAIEPKFSFQWPVLRLVRTNFLGRT